MRMLSAMISMTMTSIASPANAVIQGSLAPGESVYLMTAPGHDIGPKFENHIAWATFWSDPKSEPASFRYLLSSEYQWFQFGWDMYMDPPQVVITNSANGFGNITNLIGTATTKKTFRIDYSLGTLDGRDQYGAGELFWSKIWNEIVFNTGNTRLNYQIGYATNVPESNAWTMMLIGFGLAGLAIRKRRITSLKSLIA